MKRLLPCFTVSMLIIASFIAVDISLDLVQNVKAPPPNTIYVDDDAPNDPGPNDPFVSDPLEDGSLLHPFDGVSEGIAAANTGDTVFVFNGTYYEVLTIDKTISLVGEHRNTTTVTNDMSPFRTVEISADWVNITGFNITNGDPGIWIDANYVNISKCILFNNSYGIDIAFIVNITITYNIFSSNEYPAIRLWGSGHNVIGNAFINDALETSSSFSYIMNNIFLNGGIIVYGAAWNNVTGNQLLGGGIFVYHFAHDNYITNNTIVNSTYGLRIFDITTAGDPYSNVFTDNTILSCDNGIVIGYEAGTNEIIQNNISSNSVGIYFETATGSGNITHNEITGNEYGFHCSPWSSATLTISNNTISHNNYGFYFENFTINNIFHNDIINNTIQAYDDPGNSNQWDNGYPSGGNFWSDYNGSDFYSGPNQDILGSDGIGDTPYVFNFSQDNYPLMEPLGNLSFLREGWNFVSVPWIQPSTDIEDVLSQLNGSYNKAVWYNATDTTDHWKSYYPSKPPYMNDLKNIDHTMGFGIQITEPGGVVFDFTGTPPTNNQTIPLYTGWNMVGYPSLSNKYRPDALNNLVFGSEVDAVWTYNSGAQKWEEVGELNYFVIGKGYWIHTTQDCVWEVPL